MKTTLSVKLASAALALFLAGCDKEEDKKVALQSITVSPPSVSLAVEETQQLTATPVPENAADVAFVWSSANEAVATVSQTGLVTAVSEGNTSVKVASSGIEKSVPVTVSLKSLTDFTVTPASIVAAVGDPAIQLAVTKTPPDAGGTFTYTPGNESVVTVSDAGLVTIVGAGNTTISVASGSLSKTVPVTVYETEPFRKWLWTATATNEWEGHGNGPINLIDDLTSTFWHTTPGAGMPQSFTVDMQGYKRIEGFYLYLRLDATQTSDPAAITIETSVDGTAWTQVYQTGNLPQTKGSVIELDLEQAVIARYFRLTVTATNGGENSYTYLAEIGVYSDEEPYEEPVPETGNIYTLQLASDGNGITVERVDDGKRITVTGGDPNIATGTLGRTLSGSSGALKIEYTSNRTITDAQIFFGVDGGSIRGDRATANNIWVPEATSFTELKLTDLDNNILESWGFGKNANDLIRYDVVGDDPGYILTIKRIWIEMSE